MIAEEMTIETYSPHDRVPATVQRRLAIRKGIAANNRTWWTKARVINGLVRFYREKKVAPTSTEKYHEMVRGSGKAHEARYPSFYAVLRYFRTFRQAWRAAGVPVNNAEEEYTALEDWYIREAIGIIPRAEIARDLDRSEGGVKRYMYQNGLNIRRALGWTIHRTEAVTQVPARVIIRYMDRGDLPFYRGTQCTYIDPADLLVVEEIDWANPPADLERAVRRSLMERLLKILSGQDWAAARVFKTQPIRTTHKRWAAAMFQTPPKPENCPAAGDRVRCVQLLEDYPEMLGREGEVLLVYYRRNTNATRADTRPQWMLRVKFTKTKRFSGKTYVVYSLPAAAMERIG